MPHKAALSAAFAFLFGGNLVAELQWEKAIQEFHRSPEDKVVEARFGFKNTGQASVTVKNIRTSCGCTTADLDKKTYAPGEGGEIVAKFNFGSRRGPQRKTITVFSDDNPDQPTILDMRVFINEALTLTPALVFWRMGDAPEPKTVQLSAAPGRPVRIVSATSSNPRVAAKVETIKAGEQYVLAIRPADTAGKEAAEIRVTTDYPPDAPKVYTVHARVK